MVAALRRASLLTALAGVALIGGLSLLPTYTVRNDRHHAQLFWNDRDAYVFADTSRVGWRLSYAALLVSIARYAFGAATPPDDKRVAVTVLHIQPSKIEQHVIERSHVSEYGLWDGRIFSPSAGLWSGTSFESLSAEQQTAARQAKILYNDFSNVEGWSGRCCIMHRKIGETVFPMDLGGHRVVLLVRDDASGTWTSIAVRKDDEPEREIWRLDQRPHLMSAAE